LLPDWARTIGMMIEAVAAGQEVRVRCQTCNAHRILAVTDLERVMAAKGIRFRMTNRRTRCRLTAGCDGWNVFSYKHGPWLYHLYTAEQEMQWVEDDRRRHAEARRRLCEALEDAKYDRDRKRQMRQ
jgi:hypothetical protein